MCNGHYIFKFEYINGRNFKGFDLVKFANKLVSKWIYKNIKRVSKNKQLRKK